jgi:integrating conjugative element protein (TIGR03759 family)
MRKAHPGLWHLSDDEMQRAKLLMLGPRGNFSVPNLSPVEALGIHARDDAERRKYAELFARAQYEDVQRVLAFQRAYDVAIRQLTAGQPMISYAGVPKVDATEGAADMMNVPRSQLTGRNPAGLLERK